MPTTAKDIIEAAWSRSTFNDPDKLATDAELIGVIDRRMKQLYSVAARNNPLYFGTRATVGYDANVGGWIRPANAEMVVRIVNNGNAAEIHIVPFEDRFAEMAPRVYEFGQVYFSSGGPGDPITTDILQFQFSRRHVNLNPSQPTNAAANTLEASWPEQFNDLIVLHVSKYLALKDQRGEEVALLQAEQNELMDTFLKHLAHENYGMKARWGQRSRLVAPRAEGFRGE